MFTQPPTGTGGGPGGGTLEVGCELVGVGLGVCDDDDFTGGGVDDDDVDGAGFGGAELEEAVLDALCDGAGDELGFGAELVLGLGAGGGAWAGPTVSNSCGAPAPHSRDRNDANSVVDCEVSAIVTALSLETALVTLKVTDLVVGLVDCESRTAPTFGALR